MLDTYTATASTVEEARTIHEMMLEKMYAAAKDVQRTAGGTGGGGGGGSSLVARAARAKKS